jgi:hypothetical protein
MNCTCRFVAVGLPMQPEGCKVHDQPAYACDYEGCNCKDYRPRKPMNPSVAGVARGWPRCVCGHLAQDHNQ